MPGWFSPVSSISTGLLFGVSLLHLIPDCTTDMQNALERNGFQLNLFSVKLFSETFQLNLFSRRLNPTKCECEKCLPSDHAFDFNWIFHSDFG